MPIEVRKKTNESVEGMIRRFTRRVQQSGIVWRAKKRRFYVIPKSKTMKRQDAKKRRELNEYKDYLRKIGKIDDDDRNGRKIVKKKGR